MDICGETEVIESAPVFGPHGLTRPSVVSRNGAAEPAMVGGAPMQAPTCDDVRQLAVVVWARTKFIERLVVAEGTVDARVLAGLAEIDAAITAIGERLDRLEDALAKRAA